MKEKEYSLPVDDFGIHLAADAGVQYRTYQPLINQALLSGKEWAKVLHISERTLQRIREEKRPLDTDASERLLEINRLVDFGIEMFGSAANMRNYLNRPVIVFGHRAPKDMLSTLSGIRMVYNEIGRIAHGIFA